MIFSCHPERTSPTSESKGPPRVGRPLFSHRRSVCCGGGHPACPSESKTSAATQLVTNRSVGPMARALFVTLMLVLVGSIAHATDDVVVRSSVTPAEAWVGQRVFLTQEVLGADGWAQITDMGEVEIPGAFVMRTESQGVRLSETIGGTSYTGQRYQLSLYCQRPGRVEIPALPATVTVKRWGATPPEIKRDVSMPAATLICKVPPGAEDIRDLISTTHLNADQKWSSEPTTVDLGDAVTRTVTLSAVDVSGMAFPPIRHPEIEGVGIYPGEPSVSDTSDRGSLRGERVESVTYVLEEPGEFSLPAIVLSWWDIDDGVLRRIELPGLDLTVEGDLAPEPTVEPEVVVVTMTAAPISWASLHAARLMALVMSGRSDDSSSVAHFVWSR